MAPQPHEEVPTARGTRTHSAAAAARALLALCLLVPWPSLGICAEMLWFPGAVGLSILGFSKVWILAFPLFWTAAVDREPLRVPPFTTRGLGLGLLTGLAGALAVAGAYEFLLESQIDATRVREMARANHLLEPRNFLAVAVYICAVNSLLEEYVWRWFVRRQFERLVPRAAAVLLAGLAFTLHHTIVLQSQFGLGLAVIGSLAVFVAGVTWSWLYARTGSIWSAWLSHAIVDVAVFWAGWRILF